MKKKNPEVVQFPVRVDASVAEILVSDQAFRTADGSLFDGSPNDLLISEAHKREKEAAIGVMQDALVTTINGSSAEQKWEMSRIATLREIGGTALGSFSGYFNKLNGEASSEAMDDINDLPRGDERVIQTNHNVTRANDLYTDPLEFIDMSLAAIDRRKHHDRSSIGPENYATTLKFFADKYEALEDPSGTVNRLDIKEVTSETLTGFFDVARRDAPNFVEMTNINAAIRRLPKGSVEQRFTEPLLFQSLSLLPEYSSKAINTLFGIFPKLDLTENASAAASLVNLSLRKSGKFENTYDFTVALRAVAALPQSDVSERAFETFLTYRNDLETSLDVDGADETMYRLLTIAEHVVTSPELHMQLKQLGERTARQAAVLSKRYFIEGGLTADQEAHIKKTFSRIMANYNAI